MCFCCHYDGTDILISLYASSLRIKRNPVSLVAIWYTIILHQSVLFCDSDRKRWNNIMIRTKQPRISRHFMFMNIIVTKTATSRYNNLKLLVCPPIACVCELCYIYRLPEKYYRILYPGLTPDWLTWPTDRSFRSTHTHKMQFEQIDEHDHWSLSTDLLLIWFHISAHTSNNQQHSFAHFIDDW